ncbi:Uncharacterized protein APZ42_028481 [Daphnia magna]|uniref:Uncharacterized protein n=1 Tax=Daphnia magna TaxID=35525 RepID=A0A164QGU9_9CRUS|nr:Uncharacterized protein APZ42_028481 [Daphnia magna]
MIVSVKKKEKEIPHSLVGVSQSVARSRHQLAHYANELIGNDGLLFSKHKKNKLVHADSQHLFCLGQTKYGRHYFE